MNERAEIIGPLQKSRRNLQVNILRDIQSAMKLTGEIRKARKAGADSVEVKVTPIRKMPVFRMGYWGLTPEGCLFYGKEWKPLRDVFDSFDAETQRGLTFPPEDGEWPDRVRFWQKELRPVLGPELYHEAMLILIQWCIRCVRRRREGVAAHG